MRQKLTEIVGENVQSGHQIFHILQFGLLAVQQPFGFDLVLFGGARLELNRTLDQMIATVVVEQFDGDRTTLLAELNVLAQRARPAGVRRIAAQAENQAADDGRFAGAVRAEYEVEIRTGRQFQFIECPARRESK